MTDYPGPHSFRFSYPAGWILREDGDAVSLWKTARGGAITFSAVLGREVTGNAREHCERFAAKHAFDPPRISGDGESAEAAFTDQDGVWCKVRLLASGNRMVMGTYHASVEDPPEEAEADGILASLRIA